MEGIPAVDTEARAEGDASHGADRTAEHQTAEPRIAESRIAERGLVLIAEDDPDLGGFLRAALNRRSTRPVRLTASGREALAVLAEHPVDVLITDIQMPGMSGLELVEEVRKTQPALPIVMMTAHASVDYAVSALRHQVDEFLVKPVSAAELVPKVRELAERGTAARQMARAIGDVDPSAVTSAEVTRLERQMLMELATVMGRQSSLSEQLERAAQVQRDLLPRDAPALTGYDFAGTCVPSFAVGGDFYDWYPGTDQVDFTVADVMGKGIPAALLTSSVRAAMRSVARDGGPAAAVGAVSAAISRDLEETGTFVTMFLGRLHGPSGTVGYADAGHGLSVVVAPDGTFQQLTSGDLPVGVLPHAVWTQHEVTLQPGATLAVFSDGLFDLLGGTPQALGEVAGIVNRSGGVGDAISAVTSLARGKTLIDDVTLTVIHRCTDASAEVRPGGSGDAAGHGGACVRRGIPRRPAGGAAGPAPG